MQATCGWASVLDVPATNAQFAPASGSFAPPECGATVHEYEAIEPSESDDPRPLSATDPPSAPEYGSPASAVGTTFG